MLDEMALFVALAMLGFLGFMDGVMLRMGQNNNIFWTIIRAITVHVMGVFAMLKQTPNLSFTDKTMFWDIALPVSLWMVGLVNVNVAMLTYAVSLRSVEGSAQSELITSSVTPIRAIDGGFMACKKFYFAFLANSSCIFLPRRVFNTFLDLYDRASPASIVELFKSKRYGFFHLHLGVPLFLANYTLGGSTCQE